MPETAESAEPASYYLDTSAQIERHGGRREKRDRIKRLVSGGGNTTSSQVLREWNRIVFDACVSIRNALVKAQDWQDVVAVLRQDFGRKPSHSWMVSEWIAQSDTRDLKIVEMRAKDFQRIRARAMFNAGISEVRDGTECPIPERKPHPSNRGWKYKSTCKKTESICAQPSFLARNLTKARDAATALLNSERPNDSKMGKQALQALNQIAQNGTKGRACHGNLGIGGDICIALECKKDEVLLATDASFDLICPAIGIKHLRI